MTESDTFTVSVLSSSVLKSDAFGFLNGVVTVEDSTSAVKPEMARERKEIDVEERTTGVVIDGPSPAGNGAWEETDVVVVFVVVVIVRVVASNSFSVSLLVMDGVFELKCDRV